MTTAPTTDGGMTPQARIGWTDLAWVAWRQHRTMLLGTGALVLTGAALMLTVGLLAPDARTGVALSPATRSLASLAMWLCVGALLFPAVIAIFWAGPLLAREYDHRTHLLAWSQDVSAVRWLAGKALTLGAVAVTYALLLGGIGHFMIGRLAPDGGSSHGILFSTFTMPFFLAHPLVLLGYTLFAFMLGLAVSALARTTVRAMGLTAGLLTLVYIFIECRARPNYQSPARATEGLSTGDFSTLADAPSGSLTVVHGYQSAAGEIIATPQACTYLTPEGDYTACLRAHGIVRSYVDFQPADRLASFQLIEFGLCTLLAAVLAVVTWQLVRRATRR